MSETREEWTNLTNVVCLFLQEAVKGADSAKALFNADVQETDAESQEKAKTVKVVIATSVPDPNGLGEVRENNGNLFVECLVKPQTQTLRSRMDARETAHRMAMEITAAIADDITLGGRVCDCQVVLKEDGWRPIKTKRYQISVLTLLINDARITR